MGLIHGLPVLICGAALAAVLAAGPSATGRSNAGIPLVVSLPGLPPEAREPQAAISTKGSVYVTFGAVNTIYCSLSTDRGATFTPPVRIAEAGNLSLGMRRGPRIAVSPKTGVIVVSAVYGDLGKGRDGELLAWRSIDGGRMWSGPSRVSDTAGAAREGLHAMAAGPDGSFACAWLDLRDKGTQIWTAVSHDGGTTWSKNRVAYRSPERTVCECCHPTLIYDAQGRLLLMFRNALAGNRDLYLAHSDDGGKTFTSAQKLGNGTWPLNACPMDGGSLTAAANGAIESFWRRGNEMYACAPGRAERLIGRGQQGWSASGPQGTFYVWLQNRPGRFMVQSPGTNSAPQEIAFGVDDPVLAAAPQGLAPVIACWTEMRDGKPIALRAARLDKGKP